MLFVYWVRVSVCLCAQTWVSFSFSLLFVPWPFNNLFVCRKFSFSHRLNLSFFLAFGSRSVFQSVNFRWHLFCLHFVSMCTFGSGLLSIRCKNDREVERERVCLYLVIIHTHTNTLFLAHLLTFSLHGFYASARLKYAWLSSGLFCDGNNIYVWSPERICETYQFIHNIYKCEHHKWSLWFDCLWYSMLMCTQAIALQTARIKSLHAPLNWLLRTLSLLDVMLCQLHNFDICIVHGQITNANIDFLQNIQHGWRLTNNIIMNCSWYTFHI